MYSRLYTSPIRAPTPEQKTVDPRAWIRQDFENPEPDEKMKSAKKALLAKLDEVSRGMFNCRSVFIKVPVVMDTVMFLGITISSEKNIAISSLTIFWYKTVSVKRGQNK